MGLFKMFSKKNKNVDISKSFKVEPEQEVKVKSKLDTEIKIEVKPFDFAEARRKEIEEIENLPINNNLGIEVTKYFEHTERYEDWEMREDDRDDPTPFYKLPKYVIKEQNEMYHHKTMNDLAQGIFDTEYLFDNNAIEWYKEHYDTKYMSYDQQAVIDLAICGLSKREAISVLKITWRDLDELLFKADKKMSKHIKNASAKYGLMESQPMPAKLTEVKAFNDIVKIWNTRNYIKE